MDLDKLNKIKTPDSWISDTLDFKAPPKKRTGKKAVTVIIACLITVTLTASVSAAALPTFIDWLSSQFDRGTEITRLEGYEATENGFFIKDGEISYFDGHGLVSLEVKRVRSEKVWHGKTYGFEFEYAIKDGQIQVKNKSDNVISVVSFDDTAAIIWLATGDLWNSYFIELDTGRLTPVVSDEGIPITEGKLKLAIEVKVSEDRKYLLYRSNRYTSKTDGNKGEWFVQELSSGIETRLEKTPAELFSDEIGFIDASTIAISYNDSLRPMVFDCKTKEYRAFERINGSEFGNSMIYHMGYNDGKYLFKDLYADKVYTLPSESKNNVVTVTRELICLLSPEGDLQIYLTEQDKIIPFQSKMLSDVTAITDVKFIKKDTLMLFTPTDTYIITI